LKLNLIEDFEGFYIDTKDPNKGRFEGQVGRVRFSQYAFENKTLPSGVEIDRDQSILRAIKTISDALELFDVTLVLKLILLKRIY
jgi:hypothetical protein